MEHFMAVEPAGDDRLEVGLAHFMALYVNSHQEKGAVPMKITDFLPYKKPWPEPVTSSGRYSELDLEIMASLK